MGAGTPEPDETRWLRYASPISLDRPPVEPITGRPTATVKDWRSWFPAQGAGGTAEFLAGLQRDSGEVPGFQHDERHFAGVGRGLAANVKAYVDEHGPLPGRLAGLDEDFYCAVRFTHDAHRLRERGTPPFVGATLKDYKHLSDSAGFNRFERKIAEILTAATAHSPAERAEVKWHEMLADAVNEGIVTREEAPAVVRGSRRCCSDEPDMAGSSLPYCSTIFSTRAGPPTRAVMCRPKLCAIWQNNW
ncbi:UNVERIFIED_ORG: hypothetical protein ABIC54_006615 [Burkholderia sp. 1263]